MNRNSYVILTVLNCQRQYPAMSTLLIPNKLTEVEMPIIKEWEHITTHISEVTLYSIYFIQAQTHTFNDLRCPKESQSIKCPL